MAIRWATVTLVLHCYSTIMHNLDMGYLGFEPRTYRLKADYSTIELVTRILLLSDTYKIIYEYISSFVLNIRFLTSLKI